MDKIVGIDEVGLGCWAGPLVVAAVLLHEPIDGLTDSKLLHPSAREALSSIIYESADIGLGWIGPAVIDEVGLTEATRRAMFQALAGITGIYDSIIIDGSLNFMASDHKARAVIKADLTIPAVSAASIVAKVARDRFMTEAAIIYPKYGFERHVGYGTKYHHDMLKLHGVCELHRLSYRPVKLIANATIVL